MAISVNNSNSSSNNSVAQQSVGKDSSGRQIVQLKPEELRVSSKGTPSHLGIAMVIVGFTLYAASWFVPAVGAMLTLAIVGLGAAVGGGVFHVVERLNGNGRTATV